MVTWSDREIARFKFRVELFRRRGLGVEQAEHIADWLALRDQRRDDRRMCIECANLQQVGTCFAAQTGRMLGVDRRWQPVRIILMRCNHFEFRKPNADAQAEDR